jgi:diadenosine tetraphosphatase ApaH/serine/threonine PP2A family protein phosphatase
MRIGLISDLHANRQALSACLEHARTRHIEQWAVLGDLVGYGADPVWVVERVMEMAEQGAVVIAGNHDHMALKPRDDGQLGSSTAHWTSEQLSAPHKSFLRGLPLTAELENALLVHASADKPETWPYVDDARAAARCMSEANAKFVKRLVMVGHVHHQALYYKGQGREWMPFKPTPGVAVPIPRHRDWVVTVGSVGQPRDKDPRAMYAIYESDTRKIWFHRVPYDHAAAAQAIRKAGLPAFMADRLGVGA